MLPETHDDNIITVLTCPICSSTLLSQLQVRSDGVCVVQCQHCKMGFVAQYPADLTVYYADSYYSGEFGSESQQSYQQAYNETATHSLGWVAYFIHMLRSSGSVLDIGCASGYLLEQIGTGYSRYGIEVNKAMVQECEHLNINIIGSDILDPQIIADHASSFDIITGIAVLEHVNDFRKALQHIKHMLKQDGVFIFEVPLISETNDNTVWYNTSLEHIFYPTVEGLHYVFEQVFGLPLIGQEVIVQGYGSTFIGMIAQEQTTHDHLKKLHEHLFNAPLESLQNEAEYTFRFLIDVIHNAGIDINTLMLLPKVQASILTPSILKRFNYVWHSLLSSQIVQSIEPIVEGRAYYEQQTTNWQIVAQVRSGQIQQLEEQIQQLEEAKQWLENQRANWEAEAKRSASQALFYAQLAEQHMQQLAHTQGIAAGYLEQVEQLHQQYYLIPRTRLHRNTRRAIHRRPK